MSLDIEKLRKQIFQRRLTGETIELDLRTASGRERDAVRLLLWQTGILRLEKANFFQAHFQNQRDYAKAIYTHPLKVINNRYDEDEVSILEKGHHIGMTYGAYKWLISHEDTQVIDFLRDNN